MRKFINAIAISAVLSTTACGAGGEHPKTLADVGPGYTKDYMVDLALKFDGDANVLPLDHLTYTQAKMLGQIDAHCTDLTKQVDGKFQEYLKTSGKAGFLIGLAGAVGAVIGGFTSGGFGFLNYLKYTGGSGIGSGAFTANQKIEQAMKIVHSYCVLQQVDRNRTDPTDKRLANVIIIPLMVGRAKMPQVDQGARTLSRAQREAAEKAKNPNGTAPNGDTDSDSTTVVPTP